MSRRSIRFRLTAWYAAIFRGNATLAVGEGINVWLAIRDSINQTVDKDLRSRVEAMRNFLQRQAARTRGHRDKQD